MSDSKASNKNSDDDPIVELPSLTGNTYFRKSQVTKLDVRGLVVRCTICNKQINHHDSSKFKKHFRLSVIVCTDCYEFYGTSEFSQDENGYYNYCTWCGNGGKLFLCETCPNSFCSNCIRRNFGRSEVDKAMKQVWKCYCCEPDKISSKREFCQLIIEHCKMSEQKNSKKVENPNKSKAQKTLPDSFSWMAPAFDAIDDSCKVLQKKLDKLKHISNFKSKSAKHVVKKIEDIVCEHKKDLNSYIKVLTERFALYLKDESEKMLNNEIKKEDKININGDVNSPIDKHLDDVKENLHENKIERNDQLNDTNCNENSDLNKVEENDMNDVNYNAKLSLLQVSESSEEEGDSSQVTKAEIHPEPSEKDDEELSEETPITKTKQKTNHSNGTSKSHIISTDNEDPIVNGTGDTLLDSKKLITDSKQNLKSTVTSESSNMKLLFTSSGSDVSDCKSDISSDSKKRRNSIIHHLETTEKPQIEIDVATDTKLKLQCSVVLERCTLLSGNEETVHITDEIDFENLDREIDNLAKVVKIPKLKMSNDKAVKKSNPVAKKEKIKEITLDSDHSSSSIVLSSSSGEESETTKRKKKFLSNKAVEDPNYVAKKDLLEDSSDTESEPTLNSEDSDVVKPKKKTIKKTKAESGSSDDFQPNKKRRKYDKLLDGRLSSDTDASKDGVKKNASKKKPVKRRVVFSSDDEKTGKNQKKNSSLSHTSSTDSDEEKEKKKKKRKRIKKAATSSDEKDDGAEGSQPTPGKGRKNIYKIISSKNLAEETKEAQMTEKERRKRVQERQKLYNVIVDTAADGHEITRKMVLEIDPDSKEEIVQIHSDLVEKLKPHQVKGVKFMWECTIESIKELKKSKGSGCILAHCMGLGKTLQVITFLHTCLTNRLVNKKIRTAMVICPYNTVLNWAKEFDYWLGAINDEVLVHQMAGAKDNFLRYDVLKYWKTDGGVLIISYDIFRRLATAKKIPRLSSKLRLEMREYLIDPGPDIVICDEGHVLKNINSAVSKACCQLKTERRIVLTGTPLQNNLQEYHCMLSFVKPHLLGTAKEFRNRFVNPIMNGQYEDSTQFDVKKMKKRIHILHKLLEGCVQRCDYSALTKFLPPKHEFVISVKLSEVQIKMYRWYLDNLTRADRNSKIQGGCLFADHNQLRNLCTHPYLIHTSFLRAEKRKFMKEDDEEEEDFINDESESSKSGKSSGQDSDIEEVSRTYSTRSRRRDGEESPEPEITEEQKQWYHQFISDEDKHNLGLSGKMILLIDILKECEAIGDKCILFSQSLLTLDLVEDVLEYLDQQEVSDEDKLRDISNRWMKGLDYFRMDGSTSADFRKQYIDMFNSPNNDRARLFLVSTRAGGLGTNLVGANRVIMLDASWNPSHDVQAIFRVYRFGQKKPVYIYRLLAQGTMEEKIYDRQVTKLSLSIRVVDEQQIDRHFNHAELQELYNFEPDSQTNRPTPMVPKDTLLAEMLIKNEKWIVSYHEHDSLLQNEAEEDLTEEERQAAWNEYENEREGRMVMESNIDEDIRGFCKEPNFDEANYEGQVLPTCKAMIENIISTLKERNPTDKAPDLRKKLLRSIFQLRNAFQEKHVKVIRLKQDFVARGSVPAAINKYLEELNVVLKELTKHYENVNALVMQDNRYMMGLNTNLPPAQPMRMPQPPPPSFTGPRMPFNTPLSNAQKLYYYQMQQRVQQMAAQEAWLNVKKNARTTYPAHGNFTAPPVVTEVVDKEASNPDSTTTASSNPKSTVTIEEIE